MRLGILKLTFFCLILSLSFNIKANPIEGNVVELQILDKITARVKTIVIDVDESIKFETLIIQIFACYKTPPEQIPENFVLLKIYDESIINQNSLIYQGWMTITTKHL